MNCEAKLASYNLISEYPVVTNRVEAIESHHYEAAARLARLSVLFPVDESIGTGFKARLDGNPHAGWAWYTEQAYYKGLEEGDLICVYQALVDQYGHASFGPNYHSFNPSCPVDSRPFTAEKKILDDLTKSFQAKTGVLPPETRLVFADFCRHWPQPISSEWAPHLAEWQLAREAVAFALSGVQMVRWVKDQRLSESGKRIIRLARLSPLSARNEGAILDHCRYVLSRVGTLQNSQDREQLLETYLNLAELQGGFTFSLFG